MPLMLGKYEFEPYEPEGVVAARSSPPKPPENETPEGAPGV